MMNSCMITELGGYLTLVAGMRIFSVIAAKFGLGAYLRHSFSHQEAKLTTLRL